jgi:hypothetical protein
MVFILKDYSQSAVKISSVPVTSLDHIRDWLKYVRREEDILKKEESRGKGREGEYFFILKLASAISSSTKPQRV